MMYFAVSVHPPNASSDQRMIPTTHEFWFQSRDRLNNASQEEGKQRLIHYFGNKMTKRNLSNISQNVSPAKIGSL